MPKEVPAPICRPLAPLQARSNCWPLACAVAAMTSLLWLCVPAAQAASMRPEAEVSGATDWPSWRAAMLSLVRQEGAGAIGQLRHRYELARARGDRHLEWLHLAWLAQTTAQIEVGSSGPALTLAEQALQAAQHAGDKVAAFELLLATESTRLEQQLDSARDVRVAQAALLAEELGSPVRQGLVARLHGLAALHQGQWGEALVQFERALSLVAHPQDQADLLLLLARTALEQPGKAGAERAEGFLDRLDRQLPLDASPLAVEALSMRATAQVRLERPADAVTQALQAVALGRQLGQQTPVARAQLALSRSYLAAASPSQALATIEAASMPDTNLADRLSCLTLRALALAQLRDAGARQVLDQGRAWLRAAGQIHRPTRLQFHEAASRALELLGDSDGALRELAQAAALRATVADLAREQLVQSRIDVARGAAATAADVMHERNLGAGVGVLLLALAGLGGLAGWHGHQHHRLARSSRRLQDAVAQLRESHAARMQHLAAACHDLRQPAQRIEQVAAAMAEVTTQEPTAAREQFHAVSRCSDTLNDMLDALLDLSVLAQGRYVPRLEAVHLGDLLAEVDLHYRRSAQDKGLTWQVGSSDAVVQADRHLLRRVLFHLASNAVRHSSQGGIQILAVTAMARVWVEVADTGPGLPVDQLVGPACSHDGNVAGPIGVGTGLAIVREGCRLMAHELAVPLSSPRGSVVRVTMPRQVVAQEAPPAALWTLSGQTVAVVDADPTSRQHLVDALCLAGLRSASFATLAALHEASAAYPAAGPDALLVDLGGEHLAQRVVDLQAWRDTCPGWQGPVLALTADLRLDGLMRAAQLGVHLACKPLTAPRLAEMLRDLLRRSALEHPQPAQTALLAPERLEVRQA